ncbi:AAA family ATPase [Bacteroides caecigallinarum]|uniref:AAA family ATPase n=1 Tax=Bacteroides caecigallinarum TaxID=1411144 RepID=UPI001F3B0773|nr:AAA family ATPase [Bacteroides caecigallinarum]MCF2593891.1 AAA family ATPase [Bacteroides caecigallinarum]
MGNIEIKIRRLGPVRDSDIVLKPFMIFTGESGTGKSYTALLVHYIYRVLCNTIDIRDFFDYIGASFDRHKEQLTDDEGFLFEFTLQQFEEWISSASIRYVSTSIGNFSFNGDVSVKFHELPDTYRFYYKKEVVEVGGEMKYYDTIVINKDINMRLPYRSQGWSSLPYAALWELYLKTAYDIKQDSTFLLPPSRGGLVCLNDTGRGDFNNSSAGMYKEFINDFGQLKSLAPKDGIKSEEYSILSHDLINGKINIRENELFYEQEFGEIPITASAASIKELAPFAVMLQKGLVERYSITFEEPETNLHPELQIKSADIMASLLRKGCRLLVTTHSDYFLRRINDLIRLDLLKSKVHDKEYIEFCNNHHYSPSLTIPQEIIGAYFFKRTSYSDTEIMSQNAGDGIPFDTFRSVLQNQLTDSSYIYDKICEINETADQ